MEILSHAELKISNTRFSFFTQHLFSSLAFLTFPRVFHKNFQLNFKVSFTKILIFLILQQFFLTSTEFFLFLIFMLRAANEPYLKTFSGRLNFDIFHQNLGRENVRGIFRGYLCFSLTRQVIYIDSVCAMSASVCVRLLDTKKFMQKASFMEKDLWKI